ncbi:MAG: cyclic nucleotide-binding domain-containing protein [Verrucomicrobia bacterium]|nr:cyclic nucleotide-binding domain-containing protein [Verrucomicrobiota bacterium]
MSFPFPTDLIYSPLMGTAFLSVSLFGGLNEDAVKLLEEEAQRVLAGAGDTILQEGEPGNDLFLIESGSVRICKKCGQPGETELDRLGPGEFFGEMCILETLPRSATVQATSDVVLLRISSMTFYHLHQRLPDQFSLLLLNVARDLSRRLRRLDEIFAARH